MQGARRNQHGLTDRSAPRALNCNRARKADDDLGCEMAMRLGVAAETFEARPVLGKPDLS